MNLRSEFTPQNPPFPWGKCPQDGTESTSPTIDSSVILDLLEKIFMEGILLIPVRHC